MTPLRLYELDAGRPEFALFQFEPLFVDLTIFPDRPTATEGIVPEGDSIEMT